MSAPKLKHKSHKTDGKKQHREPRDAEAGEGSGEDVEGGKKRRRAHGDSNDGETKPKKEKHHHHYPSQQSDTAAATGSNEGEPRCPATPASTAADESGAPPAAAASGTSSGTLAVPNNRAYWADFVAQYTATPIAAPVCKDRAVPGCVEIVIKVLSAFKMKDKEEKKTTSADADVNGGGGGVGGGKGKQNTPRVMGMGIVMQIFMRGNNCGRILRETDDGEIAEVEVAMVLERGPPTKRLYAPIVRGGSYADYLDQFEPCRISLGAAIEFSSALGKDFHEIPPAGRELRLSVRHTVVAADSETGNPARVYVNTPGTPMEGEQYGIFEIYEEMTRMLADCNQPRAKPPRSDGVAEMVRFPLFLTLPGSMVHLDDGNIVFTEQAQLTYTPPTEDNIKLGKGNRPLDVSVRICMPESKTRMIAFNQSISIFPNALASAIPGLPPKWLIVLLTQPGIASLVDALIWYKGNYKKIAVTFKVDETSSKKAQKLGVELVMGYAQPEAVASFVILHIGRLLRSINPQYALQIDATSPLVTEAIATPILKTAAIDAKMKTDMDMVAASLTLGVRKDLADRRGGTAAVLCAEVAQCLASPADISAGAIDKFRSSRNIQFFVLPIERDPTPISSNTLEFFRDLSPGSLEHAKRVKGCIKQFVVLIYILPEAEMHADDDANAAMDAYEAEEARKAALSSASASTVGKAARAADQDADADAGGPETQATIPDTSDDAAV